MKGRGCCVLERARRGDEDAFSELYSRHQRTVFRYAVYMCGADAADDVVQDKFMNVLLKSGRYDASKGAAPMCRAASGGDAWWTSLRSSEWTAYGSRGERRGCGGGSANSRPKLHKHTYYCHNWWPSLWSMADDVSTVSTVS